MFRFPRLTELDDLADIFIRDGGELFENFLQRGQIRFFQTQLKKILKITNAISMVFR